MMQKLERKSVFLYPEAFRVRRLILSPIILSVIHQWYVWGVFQWPVIEQKTRWKSSYSDASISSEQLTINGAAMPKNKSID